jgi:urease accessory protein
LISRPSDHDLQRAQGSGRLVVSGSDRGTRIVDVYERSPIRIMFPKINHAIEEAVLINTAGGVAGGDRLQYDVTALPNSSIAVTTQAAERIYRALDQPARISAALTVHEDAKLAWLPQETIVFNSARLHRQMDVHVSSGAELIALEWLVLGRAAHGEQMTNGSITDSWRVKKDGRLVWADSFRITDDIFPHLHQKALISNYSTVGTLIYFGPDFEARLETLRDISTSSQCHCAATAVAELIIARFAAKDSLDVRHALRTFLQESSRIPKMWLS